MADLASDHRAGATSLPPCRHDDLPLRSCEFSGEGFIDRKTARVLAIVFLLMVCAPGIYQYWYDTHFLGRWEFNDLLERRPTADSLRKFESDLADQSRFDRWVRHVYWKTRTGIPKGPQTIVMGSDGFLFPNFELSIYNSPSLAQPAPSPQARVLPAILDYAAQLQRLGIRLVLVPIPVKSTIYPEKLAIDYRAEDGPAMPPGYSDWVAGAKAAGIDVIDVTWPLWRAKDAGSGPVFEPADIHWSYRGLSVVSDVVAQFLRPMATGLPQTKLSSDRINIDEEGDLANWITFGWGSAKFTRVQYECARLTRDGRAYVPGDEATVLLLGDSFSAIGAGDGYGLATELSLRLGMPVQTIAYKGDPLDRPRRELSEHAGALKNKRIVIWEFSQRFLWGEWEKIPLP
jgi:hypothetical protein